MHIFLLGVALRFFQALKTEGIPPIIQVSTPHSVTAAGAQRRSAPQETVNSSVSVAERRPLMAEKPLTDWSSGLCDCFEDASSCCYGFWCSPCLACSVSGQFGENYCLPLCDIFSPAVAVICDVPLFAPPAALSLRSAMRNKYGIKGSLSKDIAVSCFCVWCSWCQMHRELKHRKKTPVIINLHTVVNMQPAPVMMVPPPAGFVSQSAVIQASY